MSGLVPVEFVSVTIILACGTEELITPNGFIYMDQRSSTNGNNYKKGDYILICDSEDPKLGLYDKPLPCFGCGIGWFSLLLGFVFPLLWYYATILYFGNYYRNDPRERAGLAASAIAALICTVAVLITVAILVFSSSPLE